MTKSVYKCNRCNKLFDHKGDYNKHINRKIPCKKFPEFPGKLVPKVRADFQCPKCYTSLSSKSNLNRHITGFCPANSRKDEIAGCSNINNTIDLQHSSSINHIILGPQEVPHSCQKDALAHVQNTNDRSIFETEDDIAIDVSEHQVGNIIIKNSYEDNDTYTDSDLSNDIFGDYPEHRNRTDKKLKSNDCDIPEDDRIPSNKKQCPYCKNSFSKTNFSKHEKVCKQKAGELSVFREKAVSELQQENLAKDKAYAALREEIEQMKLLIEALQAEKTNSTVNAKNINSNNNTTIQTINNNNDIKVIAFGTEDLYSILDDNQAMKYLSKGYQAVYSLIEDMHFDPKKPEFHSVYISDKNRPNALQFNGDNWDTVEKDDVVDQLFDDKACYLNAMFKELKNKLNSKTIIKYSRFMNDTDKEVIESIKRDIKKLLYNKRHIPMATKKMLGL